jgi:hypothetical protein
MGLGKGGNVDCIVIVIIIITKQLIEKRREVHLQTVIALIVYEEAFEKTLASYD